MIVMLKEKIFETFKRYKENCPDDVDTIKEFLEEVFENSYVDKRTTIDTSLFSVMYNKWYRKNFMNDA